MKVTLPQPICELADVGITLTDDAPSELTNALAEYFAQFLKPIPTEDGKRLMCVCGASLTGLLQGSFTWGLAHGEGFCGSCGRPARGYHRPRDASGEILTLEAVLLYLPHPDDPSCA